MTTVGAPRVNSGMGIASCIIGVFAALNLLGTVVLALVPDSGLRLSIVFTGLVIQTALTVVGFPLGYSAYNRSGAGTSQAAAKWGLILNEGVWIAAAAWFLVAMILYGVSQ